MKSLWEKLSKKPIFNQLKGDTKTDVLIIGGGITGVLCAYMLENAGISYILVEASEIGSGTTKNTTAKITSQHGLIYNKLEREFNIEYAKKYLQINEKSLDKFRELCKNIDCDFEEKDSFVYSLNNRKKIEDELTALEKIGFKAEFSDKLPLPFSVDGAVKFPKQAQFNPLKFIYEISKNLNIYEHTPVRELIGTTAVTDFGKICAEKIIVATHFPFLNKHGSYFIKMYQHRSYVIALENAQNVNGMYVDENQTGLSFRNFGNLLLLGGGSHRTGKKGGNWQELRNFANKYYPKANEKYHWAAQDCMTLDDSAYIGSYSSKTNGLYVATGFNKWGMTSSMVSAMILCDMVQEKENEFTDIFSPSRTILRPQLFKNIFETTSNMLIPTTKRCSHLGCALKWNPYEHTWDCSCHGSRFTENGKLIDNPATKDLNLKETEKPGK